jgi:threonine synthase
MTGPFGWATGQACLACGAVHGLAPLFEGCPACARAGRPSAVAVTYDWERIAASVTRDVVTARPRGLGRFTELLPVAPSALVSRGEGDTPLVRCPRLGARLGVPALFVKNEGANPTWSWKDRLAAVGVTAARACGASVVTAASSGNQAVAVTAYAGAAGLRSVIATSGDPSLAFRVLMQVYGGVAVATPTVEDRWTLVGRGVRERGWFALSGYVWPPIGSQPLAVEGYKTLAYELAEAFAWDARMTVCVPTAYGDALAGIWRGFQDLRRLGWITGTPRLVAVEVGGSLTEAMRQESDQVVVRPRPTSRALSIATPVSTPRALRAVRESGGAAVTVDDGTLVKLQAWLAQEEGIYAELGSVAAVAGAAELRARDLVELEGPIVAVLSSAGLKDVSAAAERLPPLPRIPPDLAALDALLGETAGRTRDG